MNQPRPPASGPAQDLAQQWAAVQPEEQSALCTAGDSAERAEFVAGLHALADYLAANPGIPIPYGRHYLQVHAAGSDEQQRAQADLVSRMLGQPVNDRTSNGGHYEVTRSFGPVSYEFTAIPAARMAEHHALMSYRDSVAPDTVEKPAAEAARIAEAAFPAAANPPAPSRPRGAVGHSPARLPRFTARGRNP